MSACRMSTTSSLCLFALGPPNAVVMMQLMSRVQAVYGGGVFFCEIYIFRSYHYSTTIIIIIIIIIIILIIEIICT